LKNQSLKENPAEEIKEAEVRDLDYCACASQSTSLH